MKMEQEGHSKLAANFYYYMMLHLRYLIRSPVTPEFQQDHYFTDNKKKVMVKKDKAIELHTGIWWAEQSP